MSLRGVVCYSCEETPLGSGFLGGKAMIRVLFVCLGNICRSPMAEGVFQHKVREVGLEGMIETDSAGTGNWHVGSQPHPGTMRLLAEKGITYYHRARQFDRDDLNEFDYILTMDEENYADVQALGTGTAKVAPFLDYAPHLGVREVPDPYYTGGFEGVYELINAAADGLLAVIRKEHSL